MTPETMEYFIGVDVGTGSARAALVSKQGKILKASARDIQMWTPQNGFFEQSSENIWETCCEVIKDVTKGIDSSTVRGIGFDGTCSLVVTNGAGQPVSVSPSGDPAQNVILWLDHRAVAEAQLINSLKHPVLKSVGGNISLEMETPKLLWLKKNLPHSWHEADKFFDLPDFLTWRATGCESRSLCSLVCKWTYQAGQQELHGWNEEYFEQIGLEDLKIDGWRRIGSCVQAPGTPVGSGLSEQAAAETNLKPGTPVSTSIIDAHAGALGMIGCSAPNISSDFHTRLGLISGTSTCHMVVSDRPLFVEGVWGPYYSALVPSLWLSEGGQSATGKLIDHVINNHPAAAAITKKISPQMHVQEYLNNLLESLAARSGFPSISQLTNDLHVWPDFHGNRSPFADPTLLGMISGLTLASDEENLAILYLATIQALSYGTRHIAEALHQAGHTELQSVVICGGLSRNPVFVQTQADVLDLPVLRPVEAESVLLGSAALGAVAAGAFRDVAEAATSMGGTAVVVVPNPAQHRYHNQKYKVFLKMVSDQKEYRKIMAEHKAS